MPWFIKMHKDYFGNIKRGIFINFYIYIVMLYSKGFLGLHIGKNQGKAKNEKNFFHLQIFIVFNCQMALHDCIFPSHTCECVLQSCSVHCNELKLYFYILC